MWLMEQLYLLYTCCCTKCHINHPSPSPSLHYSDSCPPDQIMLLTVQPNCHTHIWFSTQIIPYLQNYMHCNAKRGLKRHRDLSVEGKSRVWLCIPSDLGKEGSKSPGQLQGVMAQWCKRGQGKHCWSKPRAEMTLPGENTPWTPPLKGPKAPCCLSKMSSGHTAHSRLTVPPRPQRAALTSQSPAEHAQLRKKMEPKWEGVKKTFKCLNM